MHGLEFERDLTLFIMQEFLAFSDGPVTLADIMKVKGHKLELSTHQQPAKREPDAKRRRTTFLSKWEPSFGAGGEIFRPSIHHFCTQPQQPQLPTPMLILSRTTHKQPGAVTVKTRKSKTEMALSADASTELNVTPSASKDLGSVTKSVSFVPPSLSKQSRSSLSSRNVAKSTSSGLREETEDIVDMARARLKRELSRNESGERDLPPEAKKAMIESPRRGQGSKRTLRSRDSQRSKGSLRSAMLGEVRAGEKLSSVESEDKMVLTGTRMEVTQNPGRYVGEL